MATLEIEIGSELLKAARSLARRHYGDDGCASTARVVQAALAMRLLFLDLAAEGGREVDEPVANWEFDDAQANDQLQADIRDLLFKRGSRPVKWCKSTSSC